MKKVFLMLALAMFLLIPLVSAETFTFDNIVTYEKNDLGVDDMKVSIDNLFGLGASWFDMELKSHTTPNEIKHVGLGEQVVMWYDIYSYTDYDKPLGDVKIVNMRNGRETEKEYTFVQLETYTEEIPVYSQICSLDKISGNETCTSEITGYKNIIRERWEEFNKDSLFKTGKKTVGIQVDCKEGEYLDAVWEVLIIN